MSGITNSYIPLHFKVEHESFAKNGNFEVTYQSKINGVDIEATHKIRKICKHKTAND